MECARDNDDDDGNKSNDGDEIEEREKGGILLIEKMSENWRCESIKSSDLESKATTKHLLLKKKCVIIRERAKRDLVWQFFLNEKDNTK